MDNGAADDNRHDAPRYAQSDAAACCWPCSASRRPDSGGVSDLEAVPNPVIHSCQILDPGRDVKRIEVSHPRCSSRAGRWATAAR